MKSTIRILAIVSLAALAGYAIESSTTSPVPVSSSPVNPVSNESTDDASEIGRTQRMKQQQERISRRLGMSAPLDANETTDPATGIDAIQELHDSGFIIPATIEEVEAALRAAASTPDTEDDKAALILKHRGSYRFSINR